MNVHYVMHNSPLPVPLLSQMNSFHILPISDYVLDICFNVILPSTPRTCKWYVYVSPQILCLHFTDKICSNLLHWCTAV